MNTVGRNSRIEQNKNTFEQTISRCNGLVGVQGDTHNNNEAAEGLTLTFLKNESIQNLKVYQASFATKYNKSTSPEL